ncbi:unnamed protein product [Didymodactylos carnosus]|uniref:Essential protein Yae1 N-terminal domain-containing protein n=1 Tax=Didymodactylos carnosus TaxID=1234261 RepID=A0A814JQI8_9BILA|nr:unnamed protein product [Didymodactylos carnosus]CAF1041204.1 unnamed protein product [Didymodactylos carnosus]CAF3609932.1 unnamed protein product [Didymodactylos carnosus]CAF3811411.1 unnamed protein product [Didymodactylos carnosus]
MIDSDSIDPLEYASTIEERSTNTGVNEGRQYGYKKGYHQGFKQGLEYALKNHHDTAAIYADCEYKLRKLSENQTSQRRLINGIIDSCKEFRSLIPNTPRYVELLTSTRAKYQHILTLDGSTKITSNTSELTF